MNKQTVLITGGCGRVGKRVSATLMAQGLAVRVLDIAKGDAEGVEYLVGDITDPKLTREATTDVDYVVHLAAIPVENGQARELFESNVRGSFEVIDAAANNGVKGFVFASTVAVYGLLHPSQPFVPRYFPIDEDYPVIPDRNYGNMKILGESFLQSYSRSHGMDSIALRIATVMNPGAETWSRASDNIGNPEHVFVRGKTMRDFMWQYVHVLDVAQAFEKSLVFLQSNPGFGFEVFNIGAADCSSTVPSMELIARYFAEVPQLNKPARFAANPNSSLYGIDKARRLLDYCPEFTWRDQ